MHRTFSDCFLGIEKIQQWTKRSLSTRPFCLIAHKDWTDRSSKIDLRDIYTNLIWATKHVKFAGVERKYYQDMTKLFQEIKLGEDNLVRLLVQGNAWFDTTNGHI